MIPEIGLVLAVYVIARLTANSRPIISRATAGIAITVALLVFVDLAVGRLTSESLLTMLQREPTATKVEDAPVTQPPKPTPTGSVTTADGGSISIPLGYGIVVAKESSLQREWIAVHEPSFPIELVDTPGIRTAYVRDAFRYQGNFTLKMDKSIRAVEVKFLIFNIWGDHVRTLSFEDVADVSAGVSKKYSGTWNLHSENEAGQHYASIAYVARVRLEDGSVVEAPIDTVLDQARRFSAKFTPEQLGPK